MTAELIDIELAYALPTQQVLEPRQVPQGTTLLQALHSSQLWQTFPNLQQEVLTLGIWSQVEKRPEQRILRAGDRIEVYRALSNDPKETRKARALKAKAERQGA